MFLFIGLGNPGARYAGNRHNIGFMAADAIAATHRFDPWRPKFEGQLAEGRFGSEKILLLKPQTFMNDSGRSAMQAVRLYKLDLDRVVVFYDELDLAPGKLRLKIGGGSAGHNGIRSLDARIGPNYRRVRLGIGHPGRKSQVHSWVLGDFGADDAGWLDAFLGATAKHAPLLAATPPGAGDAEFMSRVALDAPAPKPPAPKAEPAG
ncbi:MAG: aminoacyl-tRNA hydrolase [Pseudomonadota bacterium]